MDPKNLDEFRLAYSSHADMQWLLREHDRLRAALKLAYRHVGSMLPERLDPVNDRLHQRAVAVLREALYD